MSADDEKPSVVGGDYEIEAIDESLRQREQWVCWQNERRGDEWSKVPLAADGNDHYARSNDPETWTSFASALAYHEQPHRDTDGLGFMFSDGTVAGVDLDGCRDPSTGELEPWAKDIIERLDSYTETSPSGLGVHLLVHAIKPDGSCTNGQERTLEALDGADKEAEVEMYDGGRYFTFTGEHIDGTPTEVKQRNSEFADVHEEYVAEESTTNDGGKRSEGQPGDLDDDEEYDGPELTEGQVEEALDHVDSSLHYDDWIRVGFAVYDWDDGAAGKQLFENWSSSNTKWEKERGQPHIDDIWDNGSAKGSVTVGTLVHHAKQGGWTAPSAATTGSDGEHAPPEAVETPLAAAILDEPSEWIDGETCTITVRETTDYDAEEAQELFEHPDELPDSEKAELAMGLSGEVQAAFKAWNDNPEEWDVEIARKSEPWAAVRAMFSQEELRDDARYKAVNLSDDAYDIATERNSERMYCYDPETGVYREHGDSEIREYLDEKLQAQFKRSRVSNVLYQLESRTFVDAEELGGPEGLVCAKNGVLDLENEEIEKFSSDHLFLSHLGANYDPDADCPQWKAFVEEGVRNEDIAGLQEFIGYCLMHWDQPYKKALMLLGPKNSGKSTFLNVVNELLGGRENVAAESLHDIVDSRWGAARLHGKFANIYSDLDASVVEQSGRFKTIVGNDKQIAAEFKGEDKFDFEPVQKLLFSANRVPEAKDADGAFYDRWLHATFPNSVPEPDQDPDLEDKLLTELDGILNWALEGYHRIVDQQGRFTGERDGEEKQEFWDAYGDSIRRFKHNCLDVTGEPDDMEATGDVYNAYLRFCDSLGVNKETKTMVTRELKKDDKIDQAKRTIDGRRQQGYVGCVLNEHADALEEDDDEHRRGGLGEFGGE